jgi:hypothetical protein
VSISFRGGFLVGLAVALCIGLYLVWLWRPARQVRRHAENFLHAIEHKDWAAAANFIGSDYQDQWGNDRARVLERMQEGFRYVRGPRIIASMVYSTDDGVMELLDERVNSLPAPFELEWHRLSGKPWDWKLVRASNSAFEIPADVY